MLYSKLAFVLAVASSVTAQTYTINDIPSCALPPALSAIGTTGCATTDLACVCKQSSFLTSLSTAIQQVCSAADYATAVTVATGLCLQNGVTLSVPPSASATSAASGSSPPVSATATGSASGAASGSASGSAPAASGSSSNAAAPTSTTTLAAASGSNSGTATTTSKPAAATTNGAAVKGTWAAAGLLGVGAILAAL